MENAMSNSYTIQVNLSEIVVGERIRKDSKENIKFLVNSMAMYGQMSPILLDTSYNLVAGYHRLMAAKELKWETIEAKIVSSGETDDYYKQLEINENVSRSNKFSLCDMLKMVFETDKMLEDLGLKAKAGRQPLGSKLFTLEDIGTQLGLKRDTVKQYSRVWTNLTEEAKAAAIAVDFKNIKDLEEISKLDKDLQVSAIKNQKNINKEKRAENAAKKAADEKANKGSNPVSEQMKRLQDENDKLKQEKKDLTIELMNAQELLKRATKGFGIPEKVKANVKILYKLGVKHIHPDKGGNEDDMKNFNATYDKLVTSFKDGEAQ